MCISRVFLDKILALEKEVIWVKLDKSFFGLENYIFVAAGYRPPREGAVGTFYTKLGRDTAKYSSKGDLILVGDLNSRIGGLDQTINNIDKYDTLVTHTLDLGGRRNSQEKIVKKHGKELLDLCTKSELVILNGRKLGDLEGKYTCHKYNGSSVNDIAAVSYDLYRRSKYLPVLEPVWLSDHCPIYFGLDIRLYRNGRREEFELSRLLALHKKFKWDDEGGSISKKRHQRICSKA